MRITQDYAYEFIGRLAPQLTVEQFMERQDDFIEIIVREDLSVVLNWTRQPQSPYYIKNLTRKLFYDKQLKRKPKQVSSLMLWSNINGFLEHYVKTQPQQQIDSVRDFVVIIHSLAPVDSSITSNETLHNRHNYLAYDSKGNELIIVDEGTVYNVKNRYALLNKQPLTLTPSLNYEISGIIRQMDQGPTLLEQALAEDLAYFQGADFEDDE